MLADNVRHRRSQLAPTVSAVYAAWLVLAYDLDPRHCGRGLATAAARAVVHWAQTAQGLQRVQATVLDSNLLSIAVLEHVGMQREGLIRQYRRVRGQARDYWMYAAILRAEH
nr:GNAT family protein [Serratia marcescens]